MGREASAFVVVGWVVCTALAGALVVFVALAVHTAVHLIHRIGSTAILGEQRCGIEECFVVTEVHWFYKSGTSSCSVQTFFHLTSISHTAAAAPPAAPRCASARQGAGGEESLLLMSLFLQFFGQSQLQVYHIGL